MADGLGKVFVNIADKDGVAVVDTKQMKVIARCSTGQASGRRGWRRSRVATVLRRVSKQEAGGDKRGRWKNRGAFPIDAGADATAFDDRMVFASCADGTLTIVRESVGGEVRAGGDSKDRDGRAHDGRRWA